jgi:oligopeptide/dipeptide ABC transporter ATP-binding protein
MHAETIVVDGASVDYPVRSGLFGRATRFVHAVENVSLTLHEDETVALVGESGSGKSTLGLSILGLRPLSNGAIRWRGHNIDGLSEKDRIAFRQDVQVVFQDPYASLNPRHSIRETLRRPLRLHGVIVPDEMDGYIESLLDRVGLKPGRLYMDRYPHEFSGGQRQRVAIARAIALRPRVLIADEPVSALDVSIRTQILNLLKCLKSEFKLSMLFLSHDLGVVRYIADRVAVMYLGKIVEIGPVDSLFEAPRHPYTRVLLSAALSMRRSGTTVEVVGEAPRPTDPPSGCRFRTRCPFAFERCRSEEPLLRIGGTGHFFACHLEDGAAPRRAKECAKPNAHDPC